MKIEYHILQIGKRHSIVKKVFPDNPHRTMQEKPMLLLNETIIKSNCIFRNKSIALVS